MFLFFLSFVKLDAFSYGPKKKKSQTLNLITTNMATNDWQLMMQDAKALRCRT